MRRASGKKDVAQLAGGVFERETALRRVAAHVGTTGDARVAELRREFFDEPRVGRPSAAAELVVGWTTVSFLGPNSWSSWSAWRSATESRPPETATSARLRGIGASEKNGLDCERTHFLLVLLLILSLFSDWERKSKSRSKRERGTYAMRSLPK